MLLLSAVFLNEIPLPDLSFWFQCSEISRGLCKTFWFTLLLELCQPIQMNFDLLTSYLRCTVTIQKMETFSTVSSVHTKTREYELKYNLYNPIIITDRLH